MDSSGANGHRQVKCFEKKSNRWPATLSLGLYLPNWGRNGRVKYLGMLMSNVCLRVLISYPHMLYCGTMYISLIGNLTVLTPVVLYSKYL
jgi:hypothetical protein